MSALKEGHARSFVSELFKMFLEQHGVNQLTFALGQPLVELGLSLSEKWTRSW